MHYVFIAHTPLLLEEFPFNSEMLLKHKDRTANQTNALMETLRSLGRAVRVNLTLWLLATDHSVGEVHARIQDRLKAPASGRDSGDIFVIEASDFAGTTAKDTIAQIQTICEISSTDQSPVETSATRPPFIRKPGRRVPAMDDRSRREQVAEQYGIKPTDAMFWRLPGSYGSGRR